MTKSALTLREVWNEVYPREHLRNTATVEHRLNAIERLIPNQPPIREIDDAWLAGLRDKAIAYGYSPRSVKDILRQCVTLLRYMGPRDSGNPRGLGVLAMVPYCRPPRVPQKLPRRVALDDLSRVYVACQIATKPTRKPAPPAELWRTAIILCYATGLRRSDLFALRCSDVDRDELVLKATAKKTGKSGLFPLPQWAIDHLNRIQGDPGRSGRVFYGFGMQSRYYSEFRRVCEHAGVEPFSWHDIRRTAASEIERVAPGKASVFLQHSARSVTDQSYLNQFEEMREAVDRMRVPVGFRAAVKMHERREQQRQRKKAQLAPDDFDSDVGPKPEEWGFSPVGFSFLGRWYRLPTQRNLHVLRLLVTSPQPLGRSEIHASLREAGYNLQARSVTTVIARVRNHLRRLLGIDDGWDPIPAMRSHSNSPTAWTIHIPRWLRNKNSSTNDAA